jgi:hypothetical protein
MVDGPLEPMSHQPQLCSYQDGRMPNNNGNNSEEQKPVSSNHNLLSEEMNFQKKHQTASEQPDAVMHSVRALMEVQKMHLSQLVWMMVQPVKMRML